MTIIIESMLGAIGAGIITLMCILIKWVCKKFKADALTIQSLSHDAFFRHCRYLINKGEVTEYELESLDHLYKGYKAQGLNGSGERLYKECMDLPVKIGDE